MNLTSFPSILVLSRDAEAYRPLLVHLEEEGLELHYAPSPDKITEVAETAVVMLGEPDLIRDALSRMNHVDWVQSSWAGVTPLLPAASHGVTVTGVKGVFGEQMGAYSLAYMLDHALDLQGRRSAQAERRWDNRPTGSLDGKTLGVMGTGSIGAAVADFCGQFGMRALGFSRSGTQMPPFAKVFPAGALKQFLQQLDYLVCVLPATSDTDGLLDRNMLRELPRDAFLINVGRGNLIVEEHLVEVLNDGHLAGAVLDVFQQEPLPDNHAFWSTPRLSITAHVSARSWPEDIARLFLDNLIRYRSNQPLKYRVDPERGY